MWTTVSPRSNPKHVATMACNEDDDLLDSLWRHRRGKIDLSVAIVISNHPTSLTGSPVRSAAPLKPRTRTYGPTPNDANLILVRGNVDQWYWLAICRFSYRCFRLGSLPIATGGAYLAIAVRFCAMFAAFLFLTWSAQEVRCGQLFP